MDTLKNRLDYAIKKAGKRQIDLSNDLGIPKSAISLVPFRITQRLMGHASPEMTLRVYTNLSDDDICTDQVREIVNDLQSCKR